MRTAEHTDGLSCGEAPVHENGGGRIRYYRAAETRHANAGQRQQQNGEKTRKQAHKKAKREKARAKEQK